MSFNTWIVLCSHNNNQVTTEHVHHPQNTLMPPFQSHSFPSPDSLLPLQLATTHPFFVTDALSETQASQTQKPSLSFCCSCPSWKHRCGWFPCPEQDKGHEASRSVDRHPANISRQCFPLWWRQCLLLCFSQTGDCALFILHIRLWLCWGVFAGIVLWIKRSLFKGQSSFYFSIVQGLLSRTWEWDASSVPWEPELCMEARGSRYKHRRAGSGASIWVFGAEYLLQLPPTPDPGIILEVHCAPSSSRRKHDESTALWTLKQNKTKPRI